MAHVEFELHPPRLVNLKLERVNWETREHLGTYLHVRYHDLPSVPDFFVLRQMYDKSVTRRWHAGDRYTVPIKAVKVVSPRYLSLMA